MQATRLRLPQRAAPLARRYIGTRGSQPAQAASERPRTVNRVPFPDFVPGPVLLKRIGRCIAFGCDPRQTADAAALVRAVVDDWAGIEMALARCGTSGTLVAHRRTLLPAKDASPGGDESGLLPWKALYMREQLSRLAFEAMTGFLDHAAATAAPEFKWLWRALRTKDTRRSPGVLAITAVNLNFAPIARLGLGSHSAYVRLESCSLPDDSDDPRSPGSLVFRVFIRSSIRMTVMANATIHASLYCDVLRRRIIPTTIAPELRRVALLERSAHVEAGRQRRALMAAIEKLERETWNRDDAVEDLGSASSA